MDGPLVQVAEGAQRGDLGLARAVAGAVDRDRVVLVEVDARRAGVAREELGLDAVGGAPFGGRAPRA